MSRPEDTLYVTIDRLFVIVYYSDTDRLSSFFLSAADVHYDDAEARKAASAVLGAALDLASAATIFGL